MGRGFMEEQEKPRVILLWRGKENFIEEVVLSKVDKEGKGTPLSRSDKTHSGNQRKCSLLR